MEDMAVEFGEMLKETLERMSERIEVASHIHARPIPSTPVPLLPVHPALQMPPLPCTQITNSSWDASTGEQAARRLEEFKTAQVGGE